MKKFNQISWTATRGDNWKSDIAIDDIRIVYGRCVYMWISPIPMDPFRHIVPGKLL